MSRQILFAFDASQSGIVAYGCPVVDILVCIRETDVHGQAAGGEGDFVERRAVSGDEQRLEQQILRRIPGDGRFGEGGNIRACLTAMPQMRDGRLDVAREVADGSVDLS